ncbi:hypothetical protein [Nocardioides albertanoniae]|uniref:hypothetical protein n=1 Tax=Nocardioides albertanoniae TaxID=1175486 RepID=UPI001152B1DB|nr:hypothetical protein [Nocardioides albertanoniae]
MTTTTTDKRAGLVHYLTQPGLLGRLSRGNPKLAPWILIGVHLLPLAIVVLIWSIGLAPAFDSIHWIPAILATVIAVTIPLPMMFAFGFWGVGAASGRDGGDQFDDDFTPLVAFGLGWLRWLLQLIMIGGIILATILIWMDFRPWHLLSTAEIDAMPEELASMPLPEDWERVGEPSDDWKNDHTAYRSPHAQLEESFYAPVTYGEMKAWVNDSTVWERSEFGPIDAIECDDSLQWCDAERVVQPGEPREYTVTFKWNDTSGVTDSSGHPLKTVRVELSYAENGGPWK